jgi:hypothetical protein
MRTEMNNKKKPTSREEIRTRGNQNHPDTQIVTYTPYTMAQALERYRMRRSCPPSFPSVGVHPHLQPIPLHLCIWYALGDQDSVAQTQAA